MLPHYQKAAEQRKVIMRAVSITGFKKSGKTTLMSLLAHVLEARGLRVGIVKCTHHGLDLPNTDTFTLRTKDRDVAALAEGESAVFWSYRRSVQDMLGVLNADIVLVEGGKALDFLPRVLCLHNEEEAAELMPELAIATWGSVTLPDKPAFTAESVESLGALVAEKAFYLPGLDCKACGYEGCRGMAAGIVAGTESPQACRALNASFSVTVNGQPVGLNPFTASLLEGGIAGMVRSLKGVTPGCNVTISFKI
ncbi:MAG: molybdopterin-guanine dinucleotide biosynthesis protein MobB [Desulfovibrionaceae bacterium]|nr:molybdopterin-guanine dinucleotide biosynthesis protein MobB [Desulfovibrionaceae bacterium]